MAETHVISALVKKYQEVTGQLEACEKQAAVHRFQLDNLKTVIHMFEPEYDLRDAKGIRPIRITFRRNVFMRCAMDILREAKEPISARGITLQAVEQQGAEQDARVIERFSRYLEKTLKAKERDGSVTAQNGYPVLWGIKK